MSASEAINISSPSVEKNTKAIKTNDKEDEDFRIYDESSSNARVVEHYR